MSIDGYFIEAGYIVALAVNISFVVYSEFFFANVRLYVYIFYFCNEGSYPNYCLVYLTLLIGSIAALNDS